jgi:hypothetical protein
MNASDIEAIIARGVGQAWHEPHSDASGAQALEAEGGEVHQ